MYYFTFSFSRNLSNHRWSPLAHKNCIVIVSASENFYFNPLIKIELHSISQILPEKTKSARLSV